MADGANEIKAAIDELRPFLELSEQASARSRYVLMGLIFVSVLMFGGLWKQLSFSWFESYYEGSKQAVKLVAMKTHDYENRKLLESCRRFATLLDEALAQPSVGSDSRQFLTGRVVQFGIVDTDGCAGLTWKAIAQRLGLCEAPTPLEASGMCMWRSKDLAVAATMRTAVKDEIERLTAGFSQLAREAAAADLAEGHRRLQAKWHVDWLKESGPLPKWVIDAAGADLAESRRLRDDNVVLIHMPVFGVTFHVNDLGILGGFAIFVLLLWMRAALDEEVSGLRLIRANVVEVAKERALSQTAREDQEKSSHSIFLERMYGLLSMQQFFFRPQPFDGIHELPGSRILRYAALGLISLPLAIELALFTVDLGAHAELLALNSTAYIATLVFSGAFLTANTVFTVFAVRSALKQVDVWAEIRGEFHLQAATEGQ